MRVEEVREPEGWRLRLTGESVPMDADADPPPPNRGIDTPEKFMKHARSRDAAGRRDLWLLANGFEGGGARLPLDPDELDELL
jgi:hypothetical protein